MDRRRYFAVEKQRLEAEKQKLETSRQQLDIEKMIAAQPKQPVSERNVPNVEAQQSTRATPQMRKTRHILVPPVSAILIRLSPSTCIIGQITHID